MLTALKTSQSPVANLSTVARSKVSKSSKFESITRAHIFFSELRDKWLLGQREQKLPISTNATAFRRRRGLGGLSMDLQEPGKTSPWFFVFLLHNEFLRELQAGMRGAGCGVSVRDVGCEVRGAGHSSI